MAKIEVNLGGGNTTYYRPSELEAGTVISGRYAGTIIDQFKNNCYKLAQNDGSTKVVNGAGKLHKLMASVPMGAEVDITYLGTVVPDKGKLAGKTLHDFKVAYDASNTVQAAPIQSAGQLKAVASEGKSAKFPF